MRHFFALGTARAPATTVGALACAVQQGSAKTALVASARLAHALSARLHAAPPSEAVHVTAITAPADLHHHRAALAAVDPVLRGLAHFRFALPRSGQPNPSTSCSLRLVGVPSSGHTSGSEARGCFPGPSLFRRGSLSLPPANRTRQPGRARAAISWLRSPRLPTPTDRTYTRIRSHGEAFWGGTRFSSDLRGFQSPFTRSPEKATIAW